MILATIRESAPERSAKALILKDIVVSVLSVKIKQRYGTPKWYNTSCAYYIQFISVNQEKIKALFGNRKTQTADDFFFLCYTFS